MSKFVQLAVNGTLMRGLALNVNLVKAGAQFVREAATAPYYRLWSIDDRHPAMIREEGMGASIKLEIWEMSPDGLVQVLEQEPAGLCIGKVELADGVRVLGVLGEPWLVRGRKEITRWGGWREYCASSEYGR